MKRFLGKLVVRAIKSLPTSLLDGFIAEANAELGKKGWEASYIGRVLASGPTGRIEKTNPKDINNEKQNKPTYVVRDLAPYLRPDVNPGVIYESLLKRGVFKWLAVRRQLIKARHDWRQEIAAVHESLPWLSGVERAYARGYLKALEACRNEVGDMCHSKRWQVQDNDLSAAWWLAFRGYEAWGDYGRKLLSGWFGDDV